MVLSYANGADLFVFRKGALAVDVQAQIHAAGGVCADFIHVRVPLVAVNLQKAAAVQALYENYVAICVLRLFELLFAHRGDTSLLMFTAYPK